MEVGELIPPLRDDAQRIFKESDNNQKTTDCREISVNVGSEASQTVSANVPFSLPRLKRVLSPAPPGSPDSRF